MTDELTSYKFACIIARVLDEKIASNISILNIKVISMAKPIEKTPVIEGDDAIAIIKKMNEPPTEKDKKFAKKIRSQRNVLF